MQKLIFTIYGFLPFIDFKGTRNAGSFLEGINCINLCLVTFHGFFLCIFILNREYFLTVMTIVIFNFKEMHEVFAPTV